MKFTPKDATKIWHKQQLRWETDLHRVDRGKNKRRTLASPRYASPLPLSLSLKKLTAGEV